MDAQMVIDDSECGRDINGKAAIKQLKDSKKLSRREMTLRELRDYSK